MAVWDSFTNEKQWRDYLSHLLKTNDRALDKAIVLIYHNQTLEEQELKQSSEENCVGFTKWDAKELTDIAEKIQRDEPLTPAERAKARNKMVKYWKQLMVISKRQQKDKQQKTANEKRALAKQQFEYDIELLKRCSEEGIGCGYGICDECPVTQGLQLRLDLKENEYEV